MRTEDAQVRKLMAEMTKHGKVGLAALRSGMDRKTARNYLKSGQFPSQVEEERYWRTREDPFAADWPWLADMLAWAPTLEGKALFEYLLRERPGRYREGQLRTFQRRVKRWRAQQGPAPELFFPQVHRAGEAMQTDFTEGTSLGITLGGGPFAHLLCHPVLPYSNWEWVTVCRSESLAALRSGVQGALFRLGHVPRYHQTDNSSAATHDLRTGKRGFNEEYLALMRHLGMEPRTTAVGAKEQNGDTESSHGALKRALEQHLLLRGSREFASVEAYQAWLEEVVTGRNALRQERVCQELAVMRPLSVSRLPAYRELRVRVSQGATIRVQRNTYSVPARLRGEEVRVRVYDDRVEAYYAGRREMRADRLLGRNGSRIDYRHIIWSLVRKPGAFARYRYREELFPQVVFRRAYDALVEARGSSWRTDLEYLRVLLLAASTLESEVGVALELLLEAGELPLADAVKELVRPEAPSVPELAVPEVDLTSYDALLEEAAEVTS